MRSQFPSLASSQCAILVCISDHPQMDKLLRLAMQKAQDSQKPWGVLYVETPKSVFGMSTGKGERILNALTQAERMGARIMTFEASTVAEGVVAAVRRSFATATPVETLLVAREPDRHMLGSLIQSLPDQLETQLGHQVQVEAVPLPAFPRPWLKPVIGVLLQDFQLRHLLAAPVATLMAFVAGHLVQALLQTDNLLFTYHNIALLFLLACVMVAGRYGFLPGILTAALGFITLRYAFVPPGELAHPGGDLLTLLLFALTAAGISTYTSYALSFARLAQQQQERTSALYRINQMAFAALTLEESLHVLTQELQTLLRREVAYFLPEALNPSKLRPASPGAPGLPSTDQPALQRCWDTGLTTGAGTPDYPLCHWRFEPLVTPRDRIGVLGVHVNQAEELDPSLCRSLHILATQSASVIERLELGRAMEQSRLQRERERLRSNLLSSVSHDLKTPLASIIGSLSVYNTMRAQLSEDRRQILIQTALEEAQRLNSFISNIIDMARLESGETAFVMEWQPPEDLILRVKRTIRHRLKGHEMVITGPGRPIEIRIDTAQTEQALQNVLDNAVKYSAPDRPIEVSLNILPDNRFSIAVRDHGPGIPDSAFMTIFDKYTRLQKEDAQVAGTGLGLAIARTILERQDGTLTVSNHPEGGAVFVMTFPTMREPAAAMPEGDA